MAHRRDCTRDDLDAWAITNKKADDPKSDECKNPEAFNTVKSRVRRFPRQTTEQERIPRIRTRERKIEHTFACLVRKGVCYHLC